MKRRCCLPLVIAGLCCSAALTVSASSSQGPVASRGISERDWYRGLIWDACADHGVDPRLVIALVTVESDFDPMAVSRRGAMGLMQLMPDTARRLAVRDPFDPEQNIRAGVREFSRLVNRYSGNLPIALAAYNAGEGAVARYRGIPPFRETRNYVSRIMTLYSGRPYTWGSKAKGLPVRIMRDPSTGSAVITNQTTATSRRPTTKSLADGSSGPLSGGFGKD